ncbi:hypothetical protein FOPE_10008 [Fonsecaea pedrosoi]|nr:hypothetical protein FOPE_10008 [Fonsecaea pedrosoi]
MRRRKSEAFISKHSATARIEKTHLARGLTSFLNGIRGDNSVVVVVGMRFQEVLHQTQHVVFAKRAIVVATFDPQAQTVGVVDVATAEFADEIGFFQRFQTDGSAADVSQRREEQGGGKHIN